MNTQTASDMQEVENKVRKGVDSVIKWTDFHTKPPDCEKRAYGAGKHLYKDRVEAITRKGEAGQYPAKEM